MHVLLKSNVSFTKKGIAMSYTPPRRRWIIPSMPDSADLTAFGDLPAVAARVLWNRGIHSAAEAQAFLEIPWQARHDPFLLRDMDRAVQRIQQVLKQRERVVVYGDFDTDGVTAVALLIQLFQALDIDVRPYIPLRKGEGYGLNLPAIEKLHTEGLDLLITVDCGISNGPEIARAAELGIDVLIFDHHQPPAELPPALAVVDPKRADCVYPFKGLCGVGLAFKLYEALHKHGIRPANLRARDLLDVVALGTIADMMPLTDENRVLVHYGLQAMNESQRPGLLALCRVAGIEPGQISAHNVAFQLAPRINAAGRLEDAFLAYEMLLAPDNATAQRCAERLNTTNTERQHLMKSVQEAARELVLASGQHTQRIMVVAGENFHHGVVGLAAGRLADEFGRPVLVMGEEAGTCRGSARSVPGFNIVDALASCHDLFVKYGGHAAAAGFTVETIHLPELQRRLQAFAEATLTDEMLVPSLDIDTEAQFRELTWENQNALDQLAPFGQANPAPALVSRRAQVLEARAVGGSGDHLKLRLLQGRVSMDGISFGLGPLAEQLPRGTLIDIAYSPEVNVWRDQRTIQLKIRDLHPCSS